jgi:transcriptional regulator with XRE-family HTH domain
MFATDPPELYVPATVKGERGTRLRDEITASGIPQRKVAESLGVSAQAVTNWVSNRTRPTWDHLVHLEKLLNVEPRGRLLESYGYSMPDNAHEPVSIRGAILANPDLSSEDKQVLLAVVKRFLPDET